MRAAESILFFLPGLVFRRQAASTLAHALGAEEGQRIWNNTRRLQKTLATQRPRHSFGSNMVLRFMEWDCALYRAARERGVAEEEARRLVEEINWKAFGSMTRAVFRLSRLRSPRLLNRVRWILDLMFRVVFTAPFRRNKLPAREEIAFDVVACPLASYFNAQGVPELTSAAACRLDYHMAEVWGVTLLRTQTIAEGRPLCNFRFRTKVVHVPDTAPQDATADSRRVPGA